ncbi:hypothetical protein BKI52_10775 [marine bacterium AO1-C]|nr:hypothetical protein BKI52_10775 [marine bacterium AO1-C]
MKIRYNNKFQQQLEDFYKRIGYVVRYEKGNFKSGYCILKSNRVVVVNKYFTIEGKINCLIDILKQVPFEPAELTETDQKFYTDLTTISNNN